MKRKEKKTAILCLWGIYAAMAGVCVFLSSSSSDVVSIIINIGMFLIVAGIFFYASTKFNEILKISDELNNAAKRIRQDFEEDAFLWKKYKSDESNLFENTILKERYEEFVHEEERFESLTEGKYKCDIEDFFNRGLLDSVVKKNLCNLVAGSMTGLGILGTFIGLSMGLHEFSTGSAAEISDSIAPLMEGIKVAFHTSIYGMVFSLVFNLIYKLVLEKAYDSLNIFLTNYDAYVLRDSEYSNESEIHNLLRSMPQEIGDNIANTLAPAMKSISDTFQNFADNVSTNQQKGLAKIVDSFVDKMNKSLGGNFERLGGILETTCDMQEQNNKHMQELMDRANSMVADITSINEISSKTVEKLSEYVDKLDTCQEKINQSLVGINDQIEKQTAINTVLKDSMAKLNEQQNQIITVTSKVSNDLQQQINNLIDLEQTLNDEAKANMDKLSAQAKEYSEQIAAYARQQMAKMSEFSEGQTANMQAASKELSEVTNNLNNRLMESLRDTFKVFDKNLALITERLSGTILEIDETTKRVPAVVGAAYGGMEESFNKMQASLADIIAIDNGKKNKN